MIWLCIPFAALLLCIAVLPLIKAHWWEEHQPVVVAVLSLCFIIPFAVIYGIPQAVETILECIINDYLTFIVLLFGLFCVAGNITLEGDLAGSPRINAVFLAIGTLLASCIGTTGASMLMVRPMIKMNSWRKHKSHIMIFFIFLISNIGGCLTPIGDPPLLMGFMRGVPFFWSLHLFPMLLFNMVVLITVFLLLDRHFYRIDISHGRKPDISRPGTHLKLRGAHNIIFIVIIVIAVILSGFLPSLPIFCNELGETVGFVLFGEVKLTIPAIIEIALILTAAWLSFRTTDPAIRTSNHFTWGAIKEVAVL
ncbi:MAG: sodium:proton antiporter, partial [Lachnospiraceae bacterium]